MDKIRSKGITVFGILCIIPGLVGIFGNVSSIIKLRTDYLKDIFNPLSFIFAWFVLVTGCGVLGLKEWGRKFAIICAVYFFVFSFIDLARDKDIIKLLAGLAISLTIFGYFTRPKVKEQFR